MSIFYNSAFACVICQKKGDHIHHIDKNHSNNDEQNLVLLCQTHHDEAHTKRELSANLTPDRIKEFKSNWTQEVYEHRRLMVSASDQKHQAEAFFGIGIIWGYINHSRLIQSLDQKLLQNNNSSLFSRLLKNNILDERGIVIKPKGVSPAGNYIKNTIYDWFDHGDSTALHIFYGELVDSFAKSINPIHLTEHNWNRTFIKEMIAPGSYIFLNKGQYFTKQNEDCENAEVKVQTFKRKIRIEYFVNTRNMYGTTSIVVSFSGHRTCASLLQVKSVEDHGGDRVLHCTPIALGVGFNTNLSNLPNPAIS